jgi:HD-GYP domain-containing protein (c-di-GMP phosphodiesterase class II)
MNGIRFPASPNAGGNVAKGPTEGFEALSVALCERDLYTRAHCDRVNLLAVELGSACGLSRAQLADLHLGAIVHDIGKVGVPDRVLLKPGRLDADEWEAMKTHAVKGERIAAELPLARAAAIAKLVRHHHESFDGGGYPDGLKGENIPILCRVLLVVDGYDAMGSSRPYHEGRPHRKIMDILGSESGRKLDPEIFRVFSGIIEGSTSRVQ